MLVSWRVISLRWFLVFFSFRNFFVGLFISRLFVVFSRFIMGGFCGWFLLGLLLRGW